MIEKVYRISFKSCLRVSFNSAKIVAITLGLIILFDIIINGNFLESLPFLFKILALTTTCTIVILAPFIYFISLFYPVIVDSEGLKASTYIGKIKKFTWQEMTSSSYTKVYGMGYLVIRNNGDESLWIPIFIDNFDDFLETLLQYSKSTNPAFYAYLKTFLQFHETTS